MTFSQNQKMRNQIYKIKTIKINLMIRKLTNSKKRTKKNLKMQSKMIRLRITKSKINKLMIKIIHVMIKIKQKMIKKMN